MITVRYACSRRDFLAGKKLLAAPALAAARRKRRPFGLPSFLGWGSFFFLTIVFFLLLRHAPVAPPAAAVPRRPSVESNIWTLWGVYAAILGMVFLIVGIRLIRWAGWIQFRSQSENVTFIFGDDGVEQVKPGVRTLIRWPHFTGVAENAAVYLLRQHAGEGIILPKLLLSPVDLAALDQLLKEKLATPVPTLAAGFEVRSA